MSGQLLRIGVLQCSDLEAAVKARDARQKAKANKAPGPLPKPDVLASRRNVYDGDEFDIFSRTDVDTTRMHLGKRYVHGNKGTDNACF